VLPPWLRIFSHASPATYVLEGIRGAIINGDGFSANADKLAILAGFGALMLPGSIVLFAIAERWAKKTGKLKRQG
jgi:hypothetical protein